jgi:hypothetical protein
VIHSGAEYRKAFNAAPRVRVSQVYCYPNEGTSSSKAEHTWDYRDGLPNPVKTGACVFSNFTTRLQTFWRAIKTYSASSNLGRLSRNSLGTCRKNLPTGPTGLEILAQG